MTSIDKAKQFIEKYNADVQKIKEKIDACPAKIEYLQLEIRVLNEFEIPKAQQKAVLGETDNSQVKKLKKQLQKFEEELQETKEEQLILVNALERYQHDVGDDVAEIQNLFNQDRQLIEQKCYAHMMHAKKQYVDEILKQSVAVRELCNIDSQLQQLLVDAGRQKNVYASVAINTPFNPTYKNDTGGVYLQLDYYEVKRLITGKYGESDYNYMNKFANKKDL